MNYFYGCATLAEVKSRRNVLLREFHPDNLTRITQEINASYEQAQSDALPNGTMPYSYQVKQDQPPAQVSDRIVEVEKEVIVERVVYVDRPIAATPKRRAGPDELYCVSCGHIMKKGGLEWCAVGNTVYCRRCWKLK